MQPQYALVSLLVGLNGHTVLAAPTFGLVCDAMNMLMGDQNIIPCGNRSNKAPPAKEDIAAAAQQWRGDTQTVSDFLSHAESLSPQQRQEQGQIAFDAEEDELLHKAVLDRVFLNGTAENRDPGVVAADDVLVGQGTFRFVEDTLALFAKRGAKLTTDEVATMIKAVNQDRCRNVLPAIDSYLKAAQSVTGAREGTLKAVRPSNC
ncbi:hypothetical protein CCM_03455 [Cordyceps militaris CM01]|uniref:Uncharacterized protein n=2 Tax=Cordyceps militaris TaxID=73501 RepID=G3JAX1_CORMM|nr:uncharacterized protein CCM_03455 [Cordyceps militaris CM01]ATY60905.1 hypothetical protein A9K55_005527 [Cordyceps militaris]EGX95183.1 hypothetical protein CCM_03455 [Cordyceps militaris CM01]